MVGIILYVEDDPQIVYDAEIGLRRDFPRHEVEVCERVPDAIERVKSRISNLEIVCTDGSICEHNGWQLAQQLKDLGYKGPILYTGITDIPEEFKNLFNDTASKSGPTLTQKIKQYLGK